MSESSEHPAAVDWAQAVEQLLATETIRSERRRTSLVAGVLAFIIVLLILLTVIPGMMKPELLVKIKAARPWALALLISTTVYELGVRKWLGHLLRRGWHPTTRFRYANALIEISVPSALILIGAGPIGRLEMLTGPIPMVYFLFVFLATLQLSPRLCLFSGIVAGIEFVIVALWFLSSSSDAPELVAFSAPHRYVFMGLLFVIAGCVAGFITGQIKGQFTASMQAATERDRAVSIFGQHVSPEVADKLLKQSAEFGGETRSVCVMFLDIRDFSTFASKKTPDEVMAYLNTLLSGMIDAINSHHGIVNKFLGDGLMAVFGAPAADEERCPHALGAAFEIIEQVERMNREKMIPPTRIGIGLHMGNAVTGNVGSSTRKEYTVIGDVVNLAARIEQATKQFDGQLLVSETVWKELEHDRYESTDLGLVELKGQAKPVRIYQLA